MKTIINENYQQRSGFRNDIYRKFEKQFDCLMHSSYVPAIYIDYNNATFVDKFSNFIQTNNHGKIFFVGFTGVGKTTFLKHYFNYDSFCPAIKDRMLIMPIGWNGLQIPDDGYPEFINTQITNYIFSTIAKIYKPISDFLIEEEAEISEFISVKSPSIYCALDTEEIFCTSVGVTHRQKCLIKTQKIFPVEFASSILKYVIQKHLSKSIDKVVLIVDDVETLSETKISHLVERYLHIYTCLQNGIESASIKLLISLRPHSLKFLNKLLPHEQISPYAIYLKNNSDVIIKDAIPNIKDMFKARFSYAAKCTPTPGNLTTWTQAKNVLFNIVDDFDDKIFEMIADLCHNDIRAINSCFQMILSNRIWCQEFDTDFNHPKVNKGDYKFDIVNVVRTLACGETAVYTGVDEKQFNPNNFKDIQQRPSFDNSKVFIPNILVNLNTKELDLLPILIMQYLENCYSSTANTPLDSERISKKSLCKSICGLFSSITNETEINLILDYLFENRIIRKSLYAKDCADSISELCDEDVIYFTKKGSRILNMLETDSVLLEIYREDIRREFADSNHAQSSLDLIMNNSRDILFDDLLVMVNLIFIKEDSYCFTHKFAASPYCQNKFIITKKVLTGITNSLNKSTMEDSKKIDITQKIRAMNVQIEKRILELSK